MSSEKVTEQCDKKSENSHDVKSSSEKEFIYLANENKELKEINWKLNEKKEELERKLKSLSMKVDDEEMFNIKENIFTKDLKIKELREKANLLEKELGMSNGKISILERVLKRELKIEDVFKTMPEKEILKFFNDMVIKNIDKKEELKKQNKILLENLIIIGKEYKNMKKNNLEL